MKFVSYGKYELRSAQRATVKILREAARSFSGYDGAIRKLAELTDPVHRGYAPAYVPPESITVTYQLWIADGVYRDLGEAALRNYEVSRLHVDLCERRRIHIPGDGVIYLPQGYGGEPSHWEKNLDGSYSFFVDYYPGAEDLRFVAESDKNYLNTLLWGPERRPLPNVFPDTTKLRDTEPGVWLLWLRANCPPDIGTWYMTQLELPNIQEIVEAADKECKNWSGAQKNQYEQPVREKQVKAARLTELRARLTTLIPPVMSVLQPLEARNQLVLLPATELPVLQKFMNNLKTLQPQSLDEARLTKVISLVESWQPYVSSLPAKITALVAKQETQRKMAELCTKLQALLSKATKILDPIEAGNAIQLLPSDEQSTYRDFIWYLKSLNPDTLSETGLQQAISFIESNQSYLTTLQQKTAELVRKRAEQVTVIEEKIRKLQLKIEAAKLSSDYKRIIESYIFIKDYYRSIGALGIDCSKQLAELERNIKEAQSKLSPSVTPPQTLSGSGMAPQVAAPSPEQLRCRVIPHAELQLDQELGSGAFGTVYRGLWRTEKIAVKRLHSVQLTASSRQAFISEVEIMSKLDSERLVRLYGACVAPDPYCIVMEYMPRGSLYGLLHGMEQYSWQVALQMATDIGTGLAFLHREKVIHRDLKSLNVLLDSHYRAKICDFGLSKVRQEVSVTSTRPATAVGTNAWNAPELFGLRPKYSFASDIYAYGIILWEILTREIPYKDVLDPNEIKSAVKAGEREEIPATCSGTYRSTIERCWAQVPEQRPQALQVVQALQGELATTSVKSWHIAPELKPQGRNLEGYFLIPAGDYDMRKVVAAYERCPVPGMEVGRVTVIFNPVLNKSFADGIELLEGRFGNPAFAAKWSSDGDATRVAWRGEVIRRFETMAHPYQDPNCKHVKILPVWHGTKVAIVSSIARTGYANLATTDPGFFGKGLYSSYEAEYAYRVYGPGQYGAQAALLVNWIACFSAYPVVGYRVPGYTGIVEDPGDMVRLQEKGNFGNYDAHFVPVRPRTSDPNEGSYYPCRPQEQATYHEIVVFEKTQILPRYIVELQPSLVAPPSVAPLLAATGMFGHQQEPEAAVPLLAPSPTP